MKVVTEKQLAGAASRKAMRRVEKMRRKSGAVYVMQKVRAVRYILCAQEKRGRRAASSRRQAESIKRRREARKPVRARAGAQQRAKQYKI